MLWTNASSSAEGCWVDIFDEPEFKGLQIRLKGPLELPTLSNLHPGNWNDLIDSLEVGPHAQVTAYRNENFEVPPAQVNHPDALQVWSARSEDFRGTVQTFYPGHKVHHLAEFNLHSQISSLKIACVQ